MTTLINDIAKVNKRVMWASGISFPLCFACVWFIDTPAIAGAIAIVLSMLSLIAFCNSLDINEEIK